MLHYRTQAGQEVDVVLEDNTGHIVGIERMSVSERRKRIFGKSLVRRLLVVPCPIHARIPEAGSWGYREVFCN